MPHDEKTERERKASFDAAQREVEAIWRFLADPSARAGTTAGDMLGGVVRMLRHRATVWELQDEIELAGECAAMADILEGQCVGGAKLGIPQRRRT